MKKTRSTIPREVNFQDQSSNGGDGKVSGLMRIEPDYTHITAEINRMIPVRGPTLFDRQMSEFIHGKGSKSGNKKSAAQTKLKIKLQA